MWGAACNPPSRQLCAVPTQGGAGVIIPDSPSGCVVSNTGGRSHLLLPCGNQSLLNKVSTNALLAPGVIDAGRPQWQGADACHMNVPAPGLRGSAASAPASVPGEMGCSHFGARGSEHRDSDLGDGSVPENGLWSELRDSCLATRPDQRSGFCILRGLGLIPQVMHIPEPVHSPGCQKGMSMAWTICQALGHSRRTWNSVPC